MKRVVITGTSTGIGYASVKVLLERGFRVFGSVRKEEDADRLQREFGEQFVPLLFDVTNESAVQTAAAKIGEMLGDETLDGLVNNAGIEVAGPLSHLKTDEFRYQLEVNLIGPFVVTKAFLPLLGADPARKGDPGRIVNISSTSGRIAGPFTGAYAASKFGLEGYSDSLRRELILYGIDVIVIRPGAIVTPIWQKSDTGLVKRFGDTPFADALEKFEHYSAKEGATGFPAAVIGETVFQALAAKKPKVRYAIVPNRLTNWIIPQLIPMRTLDKLVANFMGIKRKRAGAA
ncbi:MAG: SDR family NAD(P)-dependent oxidoreductase [Verrucomicrobia bacterium]|nr:SDR family NAD(P)-dependent oxidoreductase [Verrucomicrobiota bacterium]